MLSLHNRQRVPPLRVSMQLRDVNGDDDDDASYAFGVWCDGGLCARVTSPRYCRRRCRLCMLNLVWRFCGVLHSRY